MKDIEKSVFMGYAGPNAFGKTLTHEDLLSHIGYIQDHYYHDRCKYLTKFWDMTHARLARMHIDDHKQYFHEMGRYLMEEQRLEKANDEKVYRDTQADGHSDVWAQFLRSKEAYRKQAHALLVQQHKAYRNARFKRKYGDM
jgi:hypothetical protein